MIQIASQTGAASKPRQRVAADSIVSRLANRARTINLGQIDAPKLRRNQVRTDQQHWE